MERGALGTVGWGGLGTESRRALTKSSQVKTSHANSTQVTSRHARPRRGTSSQVNSSPEGPSLEPRASTSWISAPHQGSIAPPACWLWGAALDIDGTYGGREALPDGCGASDLGGASSGAVSRGSADWSSMLCHAAKAGGDDAEGRAEEGREAEEEDGRET